MAKQSWWNRFWGIFNAKAHKALDKVEDNSRIDILKQKVRELESGHEKSVNGLAKVKALELRFRKDAKTFNERADKYNADAVKLKSRYEQASTESDKEQLKKDIILMLNKSENMKIEAEKKIAAATKQESEVNKLETKIKEMTTMIKTTKANITNLEAQSEAAKINKEISKELSDVNFDGISGQIKELEDKIEADNAEASAWDHIDNSLEDDEDRIQKMLDENSPTEDSKLFSEFMESK